MAMQADLTVKERILNALVGRPYRYRELLHEVKTADKVLYEYLKKFTEEKYVDRDISEGHPIYRITREGFNYLKLLEEVREAGARRWVPDLLDMLLLEPELAMEARAERPVEAKTIMEGFRETLKDLKSFLREVAYLYKLVFSVLLQKRFPYYKKAYPALILAKSVELRLDHGEVDYRVYNDVYKLIKTFLKKNFPKVPDAREARFTMSLRFDPQRGVEEAIRWLDMMADTEEAPQEKAKLEHLRDDLSSNKEKYTLEAYTRLIGS